MVKVKVPPPVIFGPDTICDNTTPFTFTTNNVFGGSYYWELNTAAGFVQLSTAIDATVYYLTSFKVRLTVTDANGCSSSAIKSVK